MALNSYSFGLFFFIVFILYYTVCKSKQSELLVVSSALFVLCYNPFSLLLLFFITIIAYVAAGFISMNEQNKKKCAILSTILFLGILAVFKYLVFGINVCNRILMELSGTEHMSIPILDIVLPVGISFYIFQNIGYIWDVYKGRASAESSFLRYFLFVSYFPKFTVGPIERAKGFMPQIQNNKREFTYANVVAGLRVVMIGMFKKAAVADVFAPIVNNVYDSPAEYVGLPLIIATLLYTIQIYCDFSGYADLAIGFSKMLGIDLMQNFHSPYFSKSISEFWRRWHISLSSWFRDFVYIPLGGNRVGKLRHMFNLMVTFVLSGIWHGASFGFLAWGGLHGLLICIENILGKMLKGKVRGGGIFCDIAKWTLTFVSVSIAWVFFRANSFRSAIYIVTHFFQRWEFSISYIKSSLVLMGFTKLMCLIVFLSFMILVVIDRIQCKRSLADVLAAKKASIRWSVYLLFAIYILFCKMYMAQSQQFIYFQF